MRGCFSFGVGRVHYGSIDVMWPPSSHSRSGSHTDQRGEKGSLGLNLSLISTNRGWVDAIELEAFLMLR